MAGISFLRARSPVTPKITTAHGSGIRGRRRSCGSRSGFLLCRSNSSWMTGLPIIAYRSSIAGYPPARRSAWRGPTHRWEDLPDRSHRTACRLDLRRDAVVEFLPARLELVHTLALECVHHVVVVDAEGGQVVEYLLGLGVRGRDRVRPHLTVVGERVNGRLRHRVDDTRRDELLDVHHVPVLRVLR